jgi:uncharacterized protein YcbK (DUF882 family)
MKLSENFSMHEFQCPCCKGVFNLQVGLLDKLEDFREVCGEALRINRGGGSRCPAYQAAIYINKGEEPIWTSRHLKGEAADISKISGGVFTDRELEQARLIFGGVGATESREWIHVDIRNSQKFWHYQGE